ncbi:peptide deformylase [Streptomyces sp. NPDC053048]|uniref:peptide deformylase n=1 Tax=Streptomyces sp. NPDC053048 TaxID=3365694 RepID=UPI0037D6E45E
MTTEQAAEAFSAETAYWREVRGLSKRALASAMGFDPSYVSHVESGRHKPTEDFARRADEALGAGKAIWKRWCDYEAAKARGGRTAAPPTPRAAAEQPYATGSALVVEHDAARLDYDGRLYRLTMRRRLRNTGTEPVTRYLIRISVDRYPGEPERSNAHYRQHPLTIAAPQIGIGRSAAVVQPADSAAAAIVLLNPRVTDRSEETDEQFEGCLSFFDVRGMVPRPLVITVVTTELDGTEVTTVYERGLARLIAHEIDHLDGLLYTARMRPGVEPIPVEEYRQTGRAWAYGQ